MLLNPFRLLVLCTRLSFSVSIIQKDRFIAERRLLRRPNASYISSTGERVRGAKTGNQVALANRLANWIEYNRLGKLNLFVSISNFVLLFYFAVNSILYSIFSSERNPQTDEYESLVLRHLESIYIIDFFNRFSISTWLNALVALQLVGFLLHIARSFCRSLENSKINRYRYKQMNIIELDMAYLDSFETDWRGWLRFLLDYDKHKCDFFAASSMKRELMMKKVARKLSWASKIDRFYYVNQISFDSCHDQKKYFQLRQGSEKTSDEQSSEDSAKQVATGKRKSYMSQAEMFGGFRYLARPVHRVDPKHLGILLVLTIIMNITIIFALIFSIIISVVIGLIDEKKSISDFTLFTLIGYLATHSKLAISTIERWLLCGVYIANIYEHSLMLSSLLSSYSRYSKVSRMLDKAIQFSYTCKYLRTTSAQRNASRVMSTLNSIVISFNDCDGAKEDDREGYLNDDYLLRFNDNLNCLIDLILVLLNELDDLKKFYSVIINSSILLGVVGTVLMLNCAVESKTTLDYLMSTMFSLPSWAPMVVLLFMAATSEMTVSINEELIRDSHLIN